MKKAGWESSRLFDLNVVEDICKEEGIVLHEVTKSFLSEFGGLIIEYGAEDSVGLKDILEFVAEDAVEGMGKYLTYEESLINKKLNPIGHYQCGTRMILQSEDGFVYGLSDVDLIEIGSSGPVAIDNIINRKEFKVVHEFE